MRCPAVEDLIELGQRRSLGEELQIEAHLADCPICSTLVASVVDQGTAVSPAPWGALAGKALGPYRLDAQIGKGGMGAVYRAWDERLRRNVAVKVIPVHGAHASEIARRVEIEARASAAISHPNVVAVYDVGRVDDVAFVVEELVTGESLRSLLDRGPIRPPRSLALAIDLARGLAAAHTRGVLHRDLKPENLIVADDGTLKILDFGLAKLTTDLGADLDESGQIHGTVGYLAPETARGEPADAGADIFAVGAIVFEICTGRRAFDGASHAERLTAVLRDTPPLDDEALGSLAPLIARCLDKDPQRRFQSALDLAWSLELLVGAPRALLPTPVRNDDPQASTEKPRPSRRAMVAGLFAAGLGGVALGDFMRRRLGAPKPPPQFRQLTYRQGRLMSARFTRDGGSLIYGAEWDGRALAAYILRLDGGIARQLELPPADVLSVSTRGELALCLDRRNVMGQSASGRLALAPLEGGAPRPLMEDVQEADFTPDGTELAIVRRGGAGFRLELPADRVLLDTERWITHPRVSPDGARVACLVHPDAQDDRGDVVVVDRASGHVRTLSADWDSVAGLAWDPNGERLWFSAAAQGANSAVRTVTLGGEQSLIASTTGRFRLHDVRADGKGIVSVDAWRLRTLIDAQGASGPAERDVSLTDFSLAVDLSADGATLLIGEFGIVESNNGSYLRPIDGGAPLRIGDGLPLALSPSGARVAALLPSDTLGLAIYNTANAEQPPLALSPLTRITWGRWIDEETLIVAGSAADRPARLWRFAAGRGLPVPITDEGTFGRFELDAERRRLSFVDPTGRLSILDLAAGSLRPLPGLYRDRVVCGWLSEKDLILLRPTALPLALSSVDPRTGEAAAWAEIKVPRVGFKAVDGLVIRRDGSRYAYSYGEELSQLYLMTA